VRCTLITPLLFSPDREDRRRWLRIEAKARVPEGTTLEIAYASADTNDDIKRLNDILNDTKLSQSYRVEKLLGETDLWQPPTIFAGSGAETQAPKTFPAKLFDEHDRYVLVSVSLTAASGAPLPALYELDVLYPGRTLMENLPAIYQVEETKPDSFLRALVGVLETTTQDIDDRIGALGSLINPQTAPAAWLDFIARWIGVPWDDALTLKQKRAVITNAPAIAKARGTRAGLEALLEALIPGTPRRFRVKDATADFGFAVVGGDSCAGSTLPALLGGFTRWHPLLNSNAKLGWLRLPCANQLEDGVWQLAGRVRVEVAATRAERKAWEPWLPALLAEMVPLTARLELRWVTARALRTNRLDGTLTLESSPEPHLGTDAITGLARLPEAPIRLSACGEVTGTRLR
jgi:phage tail-like protein